MPRVLVAAVVAVLALVVPTTLPAGATGVLEEVAPTVATSLPGSYLTTYIPPVAVARHGSSMTYANLDAQLHDVVSWNAFGPDDEQWCGPLDPTKEEDPSTNPRQYPLGKCPLFWSELISIGSTTEVLGLENTTPGASYTFYCTFHPYMKGTLVVLPA